MKRKDASGTDDVCVTNADEDNNPLNDFGSISGGGGYANAYNSIDAGYHYGVDLSMPSNSSLSTGGIYGNGYTAYGVYSSAACFIAGTLVQGEHGSKAIEDISAGDKVWAWDEKTGDIALKEVVETYINETDELIHVFVNGEEIISTPTHPFYSPVKGWTDACKLRAGDILVLVNGEYVIVEKVQHELLEAPIAVYNFQVADYHTYYVSSTGVLVHNTCSNPYGKKGGEAHQSTIAAIKSDLTSRGYSVVEEYRVDTSGGHKNTRYLDLYATNGYDSFGIQVGRMTHSGFPIARERRALSDIIDSGISAVFVRYK